MTERDTAINITREEYAVARDVASRIDNSAELGDSVYSYLISKAATGNTEIIGQISSYEIQTIREAMRTNYGYVAIEGVLNAIDLALESNGELQDHATPDRTPFATAVGEMVRGL